MSGRLPCGDAQMPESCAVPAVFRRYVPEVSCTDLPLCGIKLQLGLAVTALDFILLSVALNSQYVPKVC